ncbi:hypothetical protein [uncultured Desulfuromonas sp.]|uniref:hypothetical protein n=1 Tax=uncultured Desulfuromonas sp. TaxID=181013 RepID=UPI002AAB6EA4|nr:hypothetical protein [uncultured Desulfuromonas sp.]
MMRASAPARWDHFCVDKSTTKSTPKGLSLCVHLHRDVGKLAQSASVLKQVADNHRGDRSLRSALLNGKAGLLNNTQLQGGHRPARLIGATKKIENGVKRLSTFYAKDDELHDSPT